MARSSPTATAIMEAEQEAPQAPKSVVARTVFLLAMSTGKRGSQDHIPLHEIPLLRRMLKAQGQELTLLRLAEPGVRFRDQDMSEVMELYSRLKTRYTFLPEGQKEGDEVDLVATVYGNEREGLKSLALTMRALDRATQDLLAKAGKKGPTVEDLEELIAKHGPANTLEQELLEIDLTKVLKR